MAKDFTTNKYWSRILNASLCKFFILRALYDGPGHGYEIIRHVARLTDNFCVPTQGTIYPVLREFQECGCVICRQAVVNGRLRKVYYLTPKGRKAYQAGLKVWQKGLSCVQRVIDANS